MLNFQVVSHGTFIIEPTSIIKIIVSVYHMSLMTQWGLLGEIAI